MRIAPKYPIYVISKGRAKSRLTAKAFEAADIPYRIVIEPQELAEYAAVIDPRKILTLPFSNLGQGSIPARNWVWQHSIEEGHDRHWIVDDNILKFYRANKNLKVPVKNANIFIAMEEFTDRYENVPMSGPNYEFFQPRRNLHQVRPFTPNTRVYSCILLSNHVPHRWRGRYNEDTDLSIRFLKDGYCTLLFNAFLQRKMPTMTVKGGNTDELYKQTLEFDGRLEMARSLQQQHPDVVTIARRWKRWQHVVDYRPFKSNTLILKPGIKLSNRKNEFGMQLIDRRASA